MAQTIKHRNDGSYYEQGNTQGLLIPEDLPLAKIPIASTSYSAATGKALNLGDFIKPQPFVEKSGNTLVIKEDGLYLIDFGQVIQSLSGSTRNYYILINGTERKSTNYAGGSSGDMSTPIFLVDLKVNDTIRFDMYAVEANTFIPDNNNPIRVCQLKRTVPYLVANKGALVSSDEVGKVKIDADDGTMNISGEIGVHGSSRVSINRPDLWTPGVEYDFGNNLYGQHFTGTITAVANENHRVALITSTSNTFAVFDQGGIYSPRTDMVSMEPINTNHNYVSFIFVDLNLRTCDFRSSTDQVRTNAPYDVWMTYKK
ncbi:MAG: hypothetical protein LBK08_11665 [Treponema sp.]|nr:hypothetical protein [Treponema sp.]